MADTASAAGLTVPPLDDVTRAAIDAHLPSYGTSQNPVDGTAQAIVDGDPQATLRHRHDGDRRKAWLVEGVEVGEEVGGGLDEIAAGAEVEGLGGARERCRPEGQERLLGSDIAGRQAQGPLRRVVARQLAGGGHGVALAGLGDGLSERRFQLLAGDGAGAQQARLFVGEAENRRFQPDPAGTAVQDEVDPRAQACRHMGGGSRAEAAGGIGAGGGHRPVHRLEQRPRDRMGRKPQGEALEAGAAETRDPAFRPAGQHQGQRARPEARRQGLRTAVEHRLRRRRLDLGQVHDQGVEARPRLGGEDPGDGPLLGGVGPQAVDRLGRKGDEAAGGEALDSLGDGRRLVGAACPGAWRSGTV